jgi:hypothetical protein
MVRPLFTVAVFVVIALVVLRFVLGLAGVAGWVFGILLKTAIVAGLIYLGISIVSPETAKKMREHFFGPSQQL